MSKYLSKVLYILVGHKSRLILLLFSFVLVSVLEVFGIGLIGPFIALASNPELIYKNYWLNWVYTNSGVKPESQFIALIGLLIVVIFSIKSFISLRVQANVFKFSYTQQGKLIQKLMHAYLEAPYTFHLSKSSVNIVQNVITETKQFANAVLIPLLSSIANVIIILALAVLLGVTNSAAVVAVLVIILPLIFLFNHFKDKLGRWGKEGSQSNEEIIRIITHSLGGIKETRIIGCGSYFESQIAEQERRYVDAMGAFFTFKLSPRVIIETLLVIFLVGFTSVFLIVNQNIQELTSVLGVFAIASIRLIPAVSNLATGVSTLRNSSYAVDKLYADLKELEAVEELKEAPELAPYPASDKRTSKPSESSQVMKFAEEIVIDQVTYRYPNAPDTALNGISLTLKKGESIALIGKSGAGKTTLVDVILGLLTPDGGDIKVDGKSIYSQVRFWQNLIGYIPQSIFLIDDTIERNIAFGVPDHLIDRQRLTKAIQTAQLAELVEELPEGIQTKVGERGVRLSGGQRQRIGIARALYHEREILVLDEATSALDNETEGLISEAMKSLSGTKTMIIIAHRLTTVEHCDRIYMMEKGRIAKSGSYQEVVLEKLET